MIGVNTVFRSPMLNLNCLIKRIPCHFTMGNLYPPVKMTWDSFSHDVALLVFYIRYRLLGQRTYVTAGGSLGSQGYRPPDKRPFSSSKIKVWHFNNISRNNGSWSILFLWNAKICLLVHSVYVEGLVLASAKILKSIQMSKM